jgi:hypothetical protein
LDRRSLSLYSDIEDVKRRLSQLSNLCGSQHLETELRRAATNILGPIMGNMHDQTRLELNNIRSAAIMASSRAEAAYALATTARREVSARQAHQSVPNVNKIVQESNAVVIPKWEKERANEMLQEVMWERIDNHLACHELRLRRSTEQYIRAALKRAMLEAELEQNDHRSESSNRSASSFTAPTQSTSTSTSALSTSSAESLMTSTVSVRNDDNNTNNTNSNNIPSTSDYILLKRTIDGEIMNMAKYKSDFASETKREMESWKTSVRKELRERMEESLRLAQMNPSITKDRAASTTPASTAPTTIRNEEEEEAIVRAKLGPILRSHQEELDKLRSDFIVHKLQSSTRVGQLEEDVRVLQMAMRRLQSKLQYKQHEQHQGRTKSAGGINETTPTAAIVTSAAAREGVGETTPTIPLRSFEIASGRSLHDWGANDVDRWLLSWGANDAVRRRFAEIEIDGEMLTLLERSDVEGDMGMLELTTVKTVERLLEEIEAVKVKHGIHTVDVDESDADSKGSSSPNSPHADHKNAAVSSAASSKQSELDNIRKQLELYGYPDLHV